MQQEKEIEELELLRSDALIHDWSAVRLAVAIVRTWDARRSRAEAALARCKERKKRQRD